jgi:FO synthase subunit 1
LPVYPRYLPDDLRPTGVEPALAPANAEAWLSDRTSAAIAADAPAGARYRETLAR